MARRFSFFFLRSYVLVAAGILILALVLDSLLLWLIPHDDSDIVSRYQPSLNLMQARLLDDGLEADRDATTLPQRFSALQRQWETAVGAPVRLYQQDDFAGQPAFLARLTSGASVAVADNQGRPILYHSIADTNHILALGPVTEPVLTGQRFETLVITSYYVLVAIILYLWIRPFYRDLAALRRAAGKFGRDDFSTRVEVGSSSSILPVAQSFNHMAERIQYLVTAHRELTNAVSHELRTPLARFKFSMEILARTEDPEKKAAYLSAMKTDVQELEGLIDELLSYARLSEDNLQLNLSSVNLDAWLNSELAQYREQTIKVDYTLLPGNAGDGQQVSFHPELIARAIHNILRNSLRYAETGIQVTALVDGDQVIIRIADDGPGIPQDKHQSIFEPFSRLDTSRDRQSGGYGLGLAIALRILQRHQGSITVEDIQPHGACFVLRWPRQPNPAPATPA